jgi:signal transduction histidine kinase
VVLVMTAFAFAVCAGALVYEVRHELLGTAAAEAQTRTHAVAAELRAAASATAEPVSSAAPAPAKPVSSAALAMACVSPVGHGTITPGKADVAPAGSVTVLTANGPFAVAIQPDPTSVHAAQQTMVRFLLLAVPLLLMVVGALTWMAMGRALRPVEAIRAEFAEITAHDLHRRVPDRRAGDEVSRLAATMNTTLDQLQRAVSRLRTFTSDAAHELRGPLTTLLVRLELAAARPQQADWLPVASESRRDAEQLRQIVDDLLLLARLDAGGLLRGDAFAAADVVRQAVGRRAVTVLDNSAGGSVRGSRTAILRLVTNLVDNAVRHARSTVAVRLTREPGRLVLEVTDDGPGIAAADRSRIFDRFVRLDEARTPQDGTGTGLGLAIARDIAHAHGGELTAEQPQPGSPGARFVLTLPAPPPRTPAAELSAARQNRGG